MKTSVATCVAPVFTLEQKIATYISLVRADERDYGIKLLCTMQSECMNEVRLIIDMKGSFQVVSLCEGSVNDKYTTFHDSYTAAAVSAAESLAACFED